MTDIYAELAEAIHALYGAKFPSAKSLAGLAMRRAESRGFLTTLLGRRARFNSWESSNYNTAQRDGYMSEQAAEDKYGSARRRARTYKALNALLQGAAADVMKSAMIDVFDSGEWEPVLTVHDELDGSIPAGEEGERIARRVQELLQDTVRLKVPLKADYVIANHWGECK